MSSPITVTSLIQMKQKKEKIVALTAYDFPFARMVDQSGVHIILVGDSLGMVVQGKTSTLPVTMDEMIYHTRMVAEATENAMVIGAETLSRITNYEDRGSCILFGDGAGAAIVKAANSGPQGIMYSTSFSDGSGWTALTCPAYGSRYPADKPLDDPAMVKMQINGREVYHTAVRRIVELVQECLEKCDLNTEDIAMFIPHQMNARIIESVGKRLKFTDDRIFINISKYGNTSAASIPIALDECRRQGKLKSGDIILLVAFGGGLTWGANVIQV